MSIGPIQVLFFGFENTDQLRGEILTELLNLRGRGVVRVVDLLFARKDAAGEVQMMEMSDLSAAEQAIFGKVVGEMMGMGRGGATTVPLTADTAIPEALQGAMGLTVADLKNMIAKMAPGKAFGILMIEHTWAISLRDAIRRAGGVPLAQGFVTPESLMLVGQELEAMAEAKATIEAANAVKSAAVLDALLTVAAAEEVKTAVAADVLRTLILANIIEEAAAQEAIAALAAADLITTAALAAANEKVERGGGD